MKSIEEFASENIRKIRVNSANLDHIKSTGIINGSLYVDLTILSKSMVEFACRWIPVEEELPDYIGKDTLILAKRSDIEMMVMVIEEYEDVKNLSDGYWTHWRPIELK